MIAQPYRYVPGWSASSTCEPLPPPSVPLVKPPESVAPDVLNAAAPNGEEGGNDDPLIDVAVCGVPTSTLTKRIVDPTATVVTAGVKPPELP